MVYNEVDEFVTLQRKNTTEILNRFGRTITLYAISETKNAMGRVLTYTEASATTFQGDIQYATEQDLQHLEEGVLSIGDSMLYTSYDVSLSPDDEIDVDGQRWKLVKKIDSPDTDGSRDFQKWKILRV